MLPELPVDIREAQTRGISLFAGEAEESRFDMVLRDAWNALPRGHTKNAMNQLLDELLLPETPGATSRQRKPNI